MALQSSSAAVSISASAAGDRLIKITTALVVLGIAIVAAIVSYEHAYELIRTHGEDGCLHGRLRPEPEAARDVVSAQRSRPSGSASCRDGLE